MTISVAERKEYALRLKRLRRLIVVLKRVPPCKLKMSSWYCGTAACAFGHAALDPVFNKQGLHKYRDTIVWRYSEELKGEGSGFTSWDAACSFFNITEEEASLIFSINSYGTFDVTPSEVIKNVRRVIKEYEMMGP